MQQSHPVDRPQATRRPLRTWLVYLLVALVVLFAALNLDEVEVNWLIGTWQTPLIIVIVLSFAVGAAVGWFAARRRRAE